MQFFTATILEWKPLLRQDKYKLLILDSIRYLVQQGRVKVYGFVVMINHLHLIRPIQPGHKREDVQRDYLKYTARQIKAGLLKHHPAVLTHFLVNAKDSKYPIWQRHPLSINLWSREVLPRKLRYRHRNPVRAGVCRWPEAYHRSSALFTTRVGITPAGSRR